MPPFRKGPIVVDRRFDGEALHALRDAGHGRRINIVDASYDTPEGATKIRFPGSSADALSGIVRLIPIEAGEVTYMQPDPEADTDIARTAGKRFERVVKSLAEQENPIKIELNERYRENGAELAESGRPGFYSLANTGNEQRIFVVTVDSLPFACASLVIGHSQRTA
jgi:L-fucose mutarotase/ribose pyranase (RbsD/FucU family)